MRNNVLLKHRRSRRIGFLLAVAVLLPFASPSAIRAQVAGTIKIPTDKGTLQAVALGYRASKMIKAPVYNVEGKRIGRVDDIILTPSRGASYFILDVGGFLGIAQKSIAVPATAFNIVDRKVVLPGVTSSELKSLPAFKYSSL